MKVTQNFRMNPDKPAKETTVDGIVKEKVGYTRTMGNNQDVVVDTESNDCLAKKVVFDSYVKYYVKRNRSGRLLNPHTEDWVKRNKIDRERGEPFFTFKATSENVFNLYLQFLNTQNTAWLWRANRELNNA